MVLVAKNLPASARDTGDIGLIPGSGRSPEGGNGNLLQYTCLDNPTDRGPGGRIVHGVTKSRTRLKWLSMHACERTDGVIPGENLITGFIKGIHANTLITLYVFMYSTY